MAVFTPRIFFVFFFLRTSWGPATAGVHAAEPVLNPSDPCAGNPCGPREAGECVAEEASYSCKCQPGYQSDNRTCIPRGPCKNFPCGLHSFRCLAFDNFGDEHHRCTCQEGYAESQLQHPECELTQGACGRYQPCGLGGMCADLPDGTYRCACFPGYEEAASVKGPTCRRKKKRSCDTNPCGDATIAKCVDTEHGYFCLCREGATPRHHYEGGAFCKPDPDYEHCFPGACGEHAANCEYNGQHRVCTCEEGYEAKVVNAWDDQRCFEAAEKPGEPQESQESAGGWFTTTRIIIIGSILLAVLLLVILCVVLARRRKRAKAPARVGREGSVDFESRDGAAAESEADVLIKARNEDWAE